MQKCLAVAVGLTVAVLVVVSAPAIAAAPPTPVSPAGQVTASCPTFSWSTVGGARGYELVVYRAGPDDATGGAVDDLPILSRRLPAGTQSWTPSVESCLEAGGSYAWALRSLGARSPEREAWSEPALFEIGTAPSIEEVGRALDTLERYMRDTGRTPRSPADGTEGPVGEAVPEAAAVNRPAPGAASSGPPTLAAKDAPALGDASLTVSNQIHLHADSHFFKDGNVFLWDDFSTANLALGQEALSSASGTANNNTAVGRGALKSTQEGLLAIHGSDNTAVGIGTLSTNTEGSWNTAVGSFALNGTTTGLGNTGYGYHALDSNTSGNDNIGVGFDAGSDAPATASDNIFIGNSGDSSDTNVNGPTIRIGVNDTQERAFIAGIDGNGISGNTVLVSSAGELGVATSSRRFKQDIEALEVPAERLLALRPVRFHYRPELVSGADGPEVGLLAEEVAEIFPELVHAGGDGRPLAVRYDLLSVLLLDELQRLHTRVETLEENGGAAAARTGPWWRRVFGRGR